MRVPLNAAKGATYRPDKYNVSATVDLAGYTYIVKVIKIRRSQGHYYGLDIDGVWWPIRISTLDVEEINNGNSSQAI